MSPLYTIVLLSLLGTCLAVVVNDVSDIQYRPWQGSISKRFDFVCGCTLISRRWAVTAASCVQSPPYDVRFGSVKRTQGIFRKVREIIVHENYTTSGYFKYNDIAVLKFAPLKLSFSVNSIKLGETEEADNDHCYFTGWGVIRYSDDDYPLLLHQASVRTVTNSTCANVWGRSVIDEGQICTDGSKSTCRGDTGGPLVCYKDDHYELVGVSSWQSTSCSSGLYSVYTRVSHFRQWIQEKTGL